MSVSAWCRAPRFSEGGRENVRELQHSLANDAICRASEQTLAAWLWLLVRADQLAPSDIESLSGDGGRWPCLLELCQRGGERLVKAMAETAGGAVPDAIARMDWGWWLGLHVPLDGETEIPQIKIVAHAALDVRVDFTQLPPELATALCEAFALMRALLPMDLGIDVFQCVPMAGDRLADYEGLRDQGLLDDPTAALAYMERESYYDVCWADADGGDVARMLASAPDWLERERYWPGKRKEGRPDKRGKRLLALTATWRRENSPLCKSVWLPFIECVAGYVQDQVGLPEWFQGQDAVLSVEEMEFDLAVACCVFSTNPVESSLMADCRDMICEAGEEAVVSLALDASNRDTVWPILQNMATASAWMMWAQELAGEE